VFDWEGECVDADVDGQATAASGIIEGQIKASQDWMQWS
jgi:hypothetical protein